MTERTDFLSNGDISERYVYKYEGNNKEELLYVESGKLARRYLYQLDDKGNAIERTGFDQKGALVSKTSYTYEFDSNGNGIKRTITPNIQSDKVRQPPSVQLRTITYC